MRKTRWRFRPASPLLLVAATLLGADALLDGRPVSATGSKKPAAVAVKGGPLPPPLPLFPVDNWWNVDISNAPVDANSVNFISFIGTTRSVHPDFGGLDPDNPPHGIYGIPYIVVDSTQPKRTVLFDYSDESDGVDHNTDTSFPFYPIPDEAITQGQWIEGGPPGNQDPGGDRHMLIVDKDNKHLYELYALHWNGAQWTAGSGAFFDMNTNNRRPETWTSADAAGLAILPGLVRYDEVYGPDEIKHAFRVTVRATNGYVFPASHAAGTNPLALPMGARLRLKQSVTITGASATPQMLKIVAALKKYGLIVADNGSDMYISGAFDTRWDNGVLNPALRQLKASDFEVIRRGFNPPGVSINDVTVTEGNSGTKLATFTVSLSAAAVDPVGVSWATANNTATAAGGDYVANSGVLSFAAGQQTKQVSVTVNGDVVFEGNETFFVNLSAPTNATIVDAQGVGTIANDDAQAPVVVTGAASNIKDSTVILNANVNANGAATNGFYQYGLTLAYGSTTASSSLGSGTSATPLQATVTGLACATQYHFRAVATNAGGTTNGLDNTFTTSACPPPPTVTTSAATEITQTGATLNGTVNPNGGVTYRRFDYGLTASYGTTSPDIDIDNGMAVVPVSFTITGLACNTQHHYRAVGQNSGGTNVGNDLTFTTAACPAAGDNNISAVTAATVSMDSVTRDTLSSVRAELWFRARLFASRSYQFSVWPVNHEQGADAPSMSLALFSDNAGVVPAAPAPIVTSDVLEGTPNSHGDARPRVLVFRPSTTGIYKFRLLRVSGGVVPHSINVSLRETTLFSPWTSRAAGFEGFIEIRNNTDAPVNVTLRGYNGAGALQGTGAALTIPANATEFRTATQIGVPTGVFAGIVLTHDGAFGAISGNITTLNGATGLSFDSPFTPRNGGWQGPPVR